MRQSFFLLLQFNDSLKGGKWPQPPCVDVYSVYTVEMTYLELINNLNNSN